MPEELDARGRGFPIPMRGNEQVTYPYGYAEPVGSRSP